MMVKIVDWKKQKVSFWKRPFKVLTKGNLRFEHHNLEAKLFKKNKLVAHFKDDWWQLPPEATEFFLEHPDKFIKGYEKVKRIFNKPIRRKDLGIVDKELQKVI